MADSSARPDPPPKQDATLVLQSRDLFAGRSEVLIIHEGEVYRMRLTKNNRLILTK